MRILGSISEGMYHAVCCLYLLEICLPEVALQKDKYFLVLCGQIFLLEEGDLLSEGVEQLAALSPLEIDKFLKGGVLWRVLEGGELVSIEVEHVAAAIEAFGEGVEVDERDEDYCVLDQKANFLHLALLPEGQKLQFVDIVDRQDQQL
jgi:hypothetical protein